MMGNRCGKTVAGAYELTCHLTGLYPHWWVGKRFNRPIKAWACGQSNKTVREILQTELVGKLNDFGTGMIPASLILHRTSKAGIAEALDSVYVKHVTGGTSSVTLKSYEEGPTGYYGASIDFGWADEEPPASIWTEMLMRTMTTDGACILSFTPLAGLSEVVLSFLPNGLPGG
jgi:phage terminase large subunit-like protein